MVDGNLVSGRTYHDNGRYLSPWIYEKLAEDFPMVPGYRERLASIRLWLGITLAEVGRWEEAEAHHRKSLAPAATGSKPTRSRRDRALAWRRWVERPA